MHGFVELAVVRLLEHLERADAHFVQHAEVGDGERGGVHVHAADAHGRAGLRGLDLAFVTGLDRLGDVVGGRGGMFAVDGDEAFVSDAARENVDFLLELVHREDAALLVFVAAAEAAVAAAVHAEVRHVERREHHDAVVVDLVLDAVRRRAHFLEERGILHAHERGDLLHGERLARLLALGDDFADAHRVDRRGVRRRKRAVDQVLVDKMLAAGQVLVDLFLDDEMLRIILGILEMPYVLCSCHF